jgi:hypothetical protein
LRGDNKEEKMRFMNFLRVSSENENFLNKFWYWVQKYAINVTNPKVCPPSMWL